MKKTVYTIASIVLVCAFVFGVWELTRRKGASVEQNTISVEDTTIESKALQASIEQKTDPVMIDYADGTLDLTVDYKNDTEMKNDPNVVIVAGTVRNTETFFSDGMVFSACKVELSKVYKNSSQLLDNTIQVIEYGGKLSEQDAIKFVDKPGYDRFPNGFTVSYSGYPLSKVNDSVILFLTKCKGTLFTKVLDEDLPLYHLAGAIYGKLTYDGEVYKPALENKEKETRTYTISEFESFIKE